jgi:hypothetical protein
MDIDSRAPGSHENPIILKNKHQDTSLEKQYDLKGKTYIHRPLLQLYTKHNTDLKSDLGSYFSFHKVTDATDYDEAHTFFHNVISNPNLKPIEIKIVLALYKIGYDSSILEDGKVVYCCTTKNINLDNYGDNFEVSFEGRGEKFGVEIDPTPLTDKLSALLNIKVTNDTLNKTLARLDDFHYINVTPVCKENSLLYKDETPLNKIKSYLKLIEINELMQSKNLSKSWKSKELK